MEQLQRSNKEKHVAMILDRYAKLDKFEMICGAYEKEHV